MGKFYAVANGRIPGIYNTWSECEEQVKHFSNARFKRFNSFNEAVKFIEDFNASQDQSVSTTEQVAVSRRCDIL